MPDERTSMFPTRKTVEQALPGLNPEYGNKLHALETEMAVIAGRISALDQDVKLQKAKLRETALAQQIASNQRKLKVMHEQLRVAVATYNGLFDFVTDKTNELTTSERWEMIFREMDEEAAMLPEPKKGRGK